MGLPTPIATIVTSCRLEHGKVVIDLGVPHSCNHSLSVEIPTPKKMQEKCTKGLLNNAMMFRQALNMAKLQKHKAASCCLPKLDRNGYDWLFSKAWERADQAVRDKFKELRSNVKQLPKPGPFVFDQNSKHIPEPEPDSPSDISQNSSPIDQTSPSALIDNRRFFSKTTLARLPEENNSLPNANFPLNELVEVNRPSAAIFKLPGEPKKSVSCRFNSSDGMEIDFFLKGPRSGSGNVQMPYGINELGKRNNPLLPQCGKMSPAMSMCSFKSSGDESRSSHYWFGQPIEDPFPAPTSSLMQEREAYEEARRLGTTVDASSGYFYNDFTEEPMEM